MLSFNERQKNQERITAVRAAELFVTVQGLSWADSYPLAVFERTAPPARFERVVQDIQQGKTFQHAAGVREVPADADPISKRASDYGWKQR